MVTAGQALVVQMVDSAIHWLNLCPLDSAIVFSNIFPLDSDFSGGECYPTFEKPQAWWILFHTEQLRTLKRLEEAHNFNKRRDSLRHKMLNGTENYRSLSRLSGRRGRLWSRTPRDPLSKHREVPHNRPRQTLTPTENPKFQKKPNIERPCKN